MENELYRRLQQHLDKMPIPFPATQSGAELRLLKKLFTKKEAEIGLCLSALPEPAKKINRRIKQNLYTDHQLDNMLYRMMRKGAVRGVKDRRNPGKFLYSKMPLAIGMFEAQVDQITKDLAKDVYQYDKEAFAEVIVGNKTNQTRTIPLNIKIEPEWQASNYDDITQIIENSPGPFWVMNCICKQAKAELGHSCQQTEDYETCILLEGGVEFAKNLEVGREISKKETLHLITKAKKSGLVLQPANSKHPHFICCCCGCCCGVLNAAKYFQKPAEYIHSNYYASVDPEKCDVCETCLDRCQMAAINRTNNHMEINLDRCIGCGVCIPTCKGKAIKLIKKDYEYVPPKNNNEMYKKIMLERFGVLKTLKFAAKAALGQQV